MKVRTSKMNDIKTVDALELNNTNFTLRAIEVKLVLQKIKCFYLNRGKTELIISPAGSFMVFGYKYFSTINLTVPFEEQKKESNESKVKIAVDLIELITVFQDYKDKFIIFSFSNDNKELLISQSKNSKNNILFRLKNIEDITQYYRNIVIPNKPSVLNSVPIIDDKEKYEYSFYIKGSELLDIIQKTSYILFNKTDSLKCPYLFIGKHGSEITFATTDGKVLSVVKKQVVGDGVKNNETHIYKESLRILKKLFKIKKVSALTIMVNVYEKKLIFSAKGMNIIEETGKQNPFPPYKEILPSLNIHTKITLSRDDLILKLKLFALNNPTLRRSEYRTNIQYVDGFLQINTNPKETQYTQTIKAYCSKEANINFCIKWKTLYDCLMNFCTPKTMIELYYFDSESPIVIKNLFSADLTVTIVMRKK